MDFDDCADFDTDVGDISDTMDTVDTTDVSDDIDSMLDGMSLDELHDLRDELTSGDNLDSIGTVDIEPIDDAFSSDLEEITEPAELLDIEPINDTPDYSFHWDGAPTHNTEWDDETEPTSYAKKLTR